MVKTRKSSGRGKQKSAPSKTAGADSKSKTRVKGGAKKTKKKWSPISDTSPFKGFDHSQPLAQNKENIKGRKLFDDGLAEDENNTFDRLLDPNYKSRFHNIRTYTNKKKVAHESRLLEFQDCKNRESIIRWLNDTHNVFDRLTQTQCDSVRNDDNEVPLTLDMPSVSQMDMSKSNRFNNRNTQTRRSPYRLRARSLNIQIKKNSSVGRSKRYSLAGDTPSMENYYIEEVVTDEEAPIPAEKIIVDLMEDEYLDNIEKAMLQSDSEKKSQKGAKKKPRQLKITTLQCSQNKKNLVDSYPTFNLDDLENYFIENMEKVMNVSRQDAYVSTTQQGVDVQTFSLQDVINTGNNLILMLRKLLGRDDLTELQPMLSNMKEIFTGLNLSRNQMRKASTQTVILENMDKELQTEANVTSVEVQTEDLYECQNCANNNIVIKNNVLPDLVLSDKIVQTEDRMNSLEIQSNNDSQNYAKNHQKLVRISTTSSTASNLSMTEQMERIATPVSNCSLNKTLDDVCFNTEDAVRGEVGQNDQLESLDICFNTEDILRKEGNQNDVKNESGGSKGVKRLLPKSPPRDSEGLQSKRPCNKFINDDLTIDFMSCTERGRRRAPDEEVIQLSEDSDEAQFDEYLVQVMKKYGKNLGDKAEDKAAPKTSKTQEDMEHDNEDNAENLGNRTITQDNVDDVMRAINRDEEMRSILPQENVKVNILQNVVIKSAGNRGGTDDETASETSDDNFFSDVDIVESTPQKKIGSFAERR
ncbi:uncharacterized protein BDFB_005284 [Asbolus verrucosus]|uniref:Uncharacterized protein n=1 Tax=Asbolus verrucosus TaxID=1661398 RepID=A0A482W1K8_ASBVE|nr:uncharacterized protein BDFB_005284 [Asbolus verrucosus]